MKVLIYKDGVDVVTEEAIPNIGHIGNDPREVFYLYLDDLLPIVNQYDIVDRLKQPKCKTFWTYYKMNLQAYAQCHMKQV